MERKHSGGRILRTQAMKPKPRAHDFDRFTVLGQGGVVLGWVKASPGRLPTVRAAFPAGPN